MRTGEESTKSTVHLVYPSSTFLDLLICLRTRVSNSDHFQLRLLPTSGFEPLQGVVVGGWATRQMADANQETPGSQMSHHAVITRTYAPHASFQACGLHHVDLIEFFRSAYYSPTTVDHSRGTSQIATHTSAYSKQSGKVWWARRDSNPGPRDYESPALTAELRAHIQALAF